jgi:hypothetical protein
MTVLLTLVAALATGLFTGGLLTTFYAQVKISRSQERMQRKVRYWQAEAGRWRAEVEYQRRGSWPEMANPPLDPWGG